jgi:succinate dehydrogenase/fumarate reductase cytochrome b subunit
MKPLIFFLSFLILASNIIASMGDLSTLMKLGELKLPFFDIYLAPTLLYGLVGIVILGGLWVLFADFQQIEFEKKLFRQRNKTVQNPAFYDVVFFDQHSFEQTAMK